MKYSISISTGTSNEKLDTNEYLSFSMPIEAESADKAVLKGAEVIAQAIKMLPK
jgi:hypothetical protein